MRGKSRLAVGVLDQAVSSVGNFLPALTAARWFEPQQAGTVVLGMSAAFVAVGLQRAIVGEPMLSRSASPKQSKNNDIVLHGIATAFVLGILAALIGVAVWATGLSIAEGIIWIAPWIPAILVQDAARFAFFGQGRPEGTLILDLSWLLSQAALTVWIFSSGNESPALLVAAWGCGAFVSASLYLIFSRMNLLQGRPLVWIRSVGHLSGWFTAQAIFAQVQYQLVLFIIAALLSKAAAGGFRVVQLIALQPVQTLLLAAIVVLTPKVAQLASERNLPRIHQTTMRNLAVIATAWSPWIVVCVFRREILATIFPNFVEFSYLIIPMALTSFLYCLQTPFSIALRGMQRARAMFSIQFVFSITTIVAVFAGAAWFGDAGAAWGYLGGGICQLVGAVVAYRRAVIVQISLRLGAS